MKGLMRPENVMAEIRSHPTLDEFIKSMRPVSSATEQLLLKYAESIVKSVYAHVGKAAVSDGEKEQFKAATMSHFQRPETIDQFEVFVTRVAKAAIELGSAPTGIGYDVDREMGTDRQVFTIFGPHTGLYYGDVVLILKQEVMQHPDFSVTPMAGTSYKSGKIFDKLPWLNLATNARKSFDMSKLNASVPEFFNAVAGLYTRMSGVSGPRVADQFIDWYRKIDSHFVMEGHLPAVVPFSMVDKIVIPEDMFDDLKAEERDTLAKWFLPGQIVKTARIGAGKSEWDNKDGANTGRISQVMELFHIATSYQQANFKSGFSLTIHDSSKSHTLPFGEIESPTGEYHLYLRARGPQFFVVLKEERGSNPSANVVTIFCKRPLHGRSGLSYIAAGLYPQSHGIIIDNLASPDFDIVYSSELDWHATSNADFVDYHIVVDLRGESAVVMLELCGPSKAFSNKQLRLRSARGIKALGGVALAVADHAVAFDQVQILSRAFDFETLSEVNSPPVLHSPPIGSQPPLMMTKADTKAHTDSLVAAGAASNPPIGSVPTKQWSMPLSEQKANKALHVTKVAAASDNAALAVKVGPRWFYHTDAGFKNYDTLAGTTLERAYDLVSHRTQLCIDDGFNSP